MEEALAAEQLPLNRQGLKHEVVAGELGPRLVLPEDARAALQDKVQSGRGSVADAIQLNEEGAKLSQRSSS